MSHLQTYHDAMTIRLDGECNVTTSRYQIHEAIQTFNALLIYATSNPSVLV